MNILRSILSLERYPDHRSQSGMANNYVFEDNGRI